MRLLDDVVLNMDTCGFDESQVVKIPTESDISKDDSVVDELIKTLEELRDILTGDN